MSFASVLITSPLNKHLSGLGQGYMSLGSPHRRPPQTSSILPMVSCGQGKALPWDWSSSVPSPSEHGEQPLPSLVTLFRSLLSLQPSRWQALRGSVLASPCSLPSQPPPHAHHLSQPADTWAWLSFKNSGRSIRSWIYLGQQSIWALTAPC
jgi:hypothetical protein